MGPEKFQYVQRKSRTTKAKQSRKTSTQPLQRPKRHGHAAAASRALKFVRPPSLPSEDAHLGHPASGTQRPSRPAPEPPSPTRAHPRPPAPAARQRAASAGGHRPSAGSARWRRCARTPRVARAAQCHESCRHPGGVPRLHARESRAPRASKWQPGVGGAPTKPRPVFAPCRCGPSLGSPRKLRTGVRGPERTRVERSTRPAPCRKHGGFRTLPSAFRQLRAENRRVRVKAISNL